MLLQVYRTKTFLQRFEFFVVVGTYYRGADGVIIVYDVCISSLVLIV